jgi:hypothetical protein
MFVSLPKAATMTLFKVLRVHYGPLLKRGWHRAKVPPEYRGYFVWTVCRNPYTRAISSWWSTIGSGRNHPNGQPYYPDLARGTSFSEFVRWMTDPKRESGGGRPFDQYFVSSQTSRLARIGKEPDRVLRFENLHEEFAALPFYNGKPKKWPRINTSEGKQEVAKLPKPEEIYDQETADLIWGWEREVFKRFQYPRESWKEL